MTTVRVEHAGEVAIVRMERARGNAIDGGFWSEVPAALAEVTRLRARAVVRTGKERVFGAGLDLGYATSLHREGLVGFVEAFDRFFLDVFRFELPIVAAVNGH